MKIDIGPGKTFLRQAAPPAGSLRSATALTAVFAVAMVSPTAAQEEELPDTRRLSLNLNNEFSAIDNARLAPDSPGVSTRFTTRLGAEVEIRNPLNQLLFSTSTGLRFSDTPEAGSDAEIDDPRLSLRYVRSGAIAGLNLSANYRSDDISFLRPLTDFVDEEGEIVIPEDIDDLTGSGTRTTYGTRTRLTVARDAPISFSFNVGLSGRDYSDVTNPALFDTQTLSYGAAATFNFVPEVITGTLRYDVSEFSADDAVMTERDRRTLNASISAELSPVLTGQLSLGHTEIETRRTTGTTRTDGPNLGVGLSLARPNGTIGLDFSNTTNTTGERSSLSLSRSFELPLATLSGSIGVTRLDQGDLQTTAGLNYDQPLPNGDLNLSLRRTVRFIEEEAADQQLTALNLSHTYRITDISSLSFQAAFAETEDSTRHSLSASYNQAVTKDWTLSSGYEFTRLDNTGGDRDRHRVFVRLGRSFDFPF